MEKPVEARPSPRKLEWVTPIMASGALVLPVFAAAGREP